MTKTPSHPRTRPRRRRRVVVITALALLVAGGGTAAWFLTRPDDAPAATRQVVTVSPTTLKTTVSASGTLEPKRRADLTFSSAGAVTAVNVAVGDEVTEGQALATSDTSELDIALQSAEADLTAARESLADLEDSGDATDAAINAAEAAVQVKTNAVTQAGSNLTAATLTAPFAGIVAEVNVAVGDSTGSSASSAASGGSGAGATPTGTTSTTSTAAIVLISKDTFTVSTSVSSSDVASVKRGLQAELTVSGSTEPVYGTVSSVAVVATSSTSGTASFPVTINVTGTPTGLFAGSRVTAEIVVKQQSDVIAISPAAVTTTDGRSTVTKVVDGVDTETEITTGETVNGSVIVTDGLAEGDQIVIEVTAPTGGSDARGGGLGTGQGLTGGDQLTGPPGQLQGQAPDGGQGGIPGGGFPGQQGGSNG